MDDFTFGKDKAAIVLANILTELKNSRLSQKVSSRLKNYQTRLKQLSFIPDKEFQQEIVSRYRKHEIAKISKMNAPDYVKSHLTNVMTTNAKEHKRKFCQGEI